MKSKKSCINLYRGDYNFTLEGGASAVVIDIFKLVEKKDKTYGVVKEAVEIIYATDGIAPGKQVAWDTYANLGVGTHELKIKIDTYDIDTGKQCYGAIQDVKGIVNE